MRNEEFLQVAREYEINVFINNRYISIIGKRNNGALLFLTMQCYQFS